MKKTISLLFTHNFNEESAKNYIKAIEFTISQIQNHNLLMQYNNLQYKEDLIELKQFASKVDALVLTGGLDIDPAKYGEKPHPKTKIMDKNKEYTDFKLIELFFKNKKPILGICLGCQELNVFFGGTLYQDIPQQRMIFIHKGMEGEDTKHLVRVEMDSLLGELVDSPYFEVVSNHHQGIKDVGDGLREVAYSEDDHLIEALEHQDPNYLIIGVQWHPERDVSKSEESQNLFKKFLNKVIEFNS